jgi:hypothetical protein
MNGAPPVNFCSGWRKACTSESTKDGIIYVEAFRPSRRSGNFGHRTLWAGWVTNGFWAGALMEDVMVQAMIPRNAMLLGSAITLNPAQSARLQL